MIPPVSGSVHQGGQDGVASFSSVCSQTPARNNEEAGSTELKQIDARQPTAAAGSLRSQSHEEEEQRRNWEASQEEGVLRTKPGRGSPTQSLSCRCTYILQLRFPDPVFRGMSGFM